MADGERRPVTLGFVGRAALLVVAVLALAALLWLGRDLLFVAFLAVLVALFLSIFVDPLERLGVPRAAGAVSVLLVVVALLAGLGSLAWPALESQFEIISRQLPEAISDVIAWADAQYRTIAGRFQPTEPLREEIEVRLSTELATLVAGALPLLNTLVGAVAGLFIAIFAGLYLAIESKLYARGAARLVPPAQRAAVVEAVAEAGGSLRRWMAGTVINMLIVGGLTALGLTLLGIPAALALGVIAGLFEFIPILGPLLAAVPALAVAFVVSPMHAVWVALLYIVIQQIESNLLTPLVMKGAVKLPPALTMLVQMLMAVLFGFLGLLLAVPILAASMVLTRKLYVEPLEARHAASRQAVAIPFDERLSRGSRRSG